MKLCMRRELKDGFPAERVGFSSIQAFGGAEVRNKYAVSRNVPVPPASPRQEREVRTLLGAMNAVVQSDKKKGETTPTIDEPLCAREEASRKRLAAENPEWCKKIRIEEENKRDEKRGEAEALRKKTEALKKHKRPKESV